MEKRFTFKKEERLCSKKIFDQVFEKSQSLFSHPVKLMWLELPLNEKYFPIQTAFVVPKRAFKKAVDRNRIKRIMREAFRLNKNSFYETCMKTNKSYALVWVYVANALPDSAKMHNKIILLLQRLNSSNEQIVERPADRID